MAQLRVVWVCDTQAVTLEPATVMVGPVTPVEVAYMVAGNAVVYAVLSPKYDSSAVIRLRRSDFSVARYAFSLVLANFGIAIAARMPIITTTINSSMSVKPLRFIWTTPYVRSSYVYTAVTHKCRLHAAGRPSNKSLRSNGLGAMRGP